MYIIVWKEKSESDRQYAIVEKETDLSPIVEKISKNGKEPKITLYQAVEKAFLLKYEDITETITRQVPTVTIL